MAWCYSSLWYYIFCDFLVCLWLKCSPCWHYGFIFSRLQIHCSGDRSSPLNAVCVHFDRTGAWDLINLRSSFQVFEKNNSHEDKSASTVSASDTLTDCLFTGLDWPSQAYADLSLLKRSICGTFEVQTPSHSILLPTMPKQGNGGREKQLKNMAEKQEGMHISKAGGLFYTWGH